MEIQLSDHFTYKRLLRFTLPSVAMMIFMSVYGVVDGLFVSNYVGKTAFASVNLIMPFIQILGGVGAMLGVGGSALVAKTLGERDNHRANRYFTMMMYLLLIVGGVFTVLGIVFIRPVSYLLGATEGMIDDCEIYGRTVMLFSIFMHMQYQFQSYLVVAEKPNLGLIVTIAAGITNMVLDALFVAVFDWGIIGAAIATGMSQFVGGVVPLMWFLSSRNHSQLHFTKTKMECKPILRACINGASEMLSSVSGSITGMLYNLQLMKYAGENGVASYGTVMYATFVFVAVLMGYSTGSSPIVGYHYGAQNHAEMKNLLRKSMVILLLGGTALTGISLLAAEPVSRIFVGYDAELMEQTVRAFRICSLPFIIMGVGMYTSSFFTALNDGIVSMEISVLRSMIFPICCIIVLPMLYQLDGVWYSLVASEVLSVGASVLFLLAKRKKYHY